MGNDNTSIKTQTTIPKTKLVIPTTINNLLRKIDIDMTILETYILLMDQKATLEIILTRGKGNVCLLITNFIRYNYKRQILSFLKEILSYISLDADTLTKVTICPKAYQPQIAGILFAEKMFNYPELVQLRCFFRKQFGKDLNLFEGNGM